MDRRKFLHRALGTIAATATTSLWLPPAATAIANSDPTVFYPPVGGYPDFSQFKIEQTPWKPWSIVGWKNSYTTNYCFETWSKNIDDRSIQEGDTVRITSNGYSCDVIVYRKELQLGRQNTSGIRFFATGIKEDTLTPVTELNLDNKFSGMVSRSLSIQPAFYMTPYSVRMQI